MAEQPPNLRPDFKDRRLKDEDALKVRIVRAGITNLVHLAKEAFGYDPATHTARDVQIEDMILGVINEIMPPLHVADPEAVHRVVSAGPVDLDRLAKDLGFPQPEAA